MLMYKRYNPNPDNKRVGDCIIRAITKATGKSWDQIYWELANLGFEMCVMPSENEVWHEYLYRVGFNRYIIPDTCPSCYTVRDFAYDHPYGTFILGTGSHVIAVVNGDYYDTWDSGDEVPVFYWRR